MRTASITSSVTTSVTASATASATTNQLERRIELASVAGEKHFMHHPIELNALFFAGIRLHNAMN